MLGEEHALAPEAGGGEVRDVVRDGLHLLQESRLARQRDIAREVHGPVTPSLGQPTPATLAGVR
jgi:hypothetical protein